MIRFSVTKITVPLRWAAGGLFVGWMFLFTASMSVSTHFCFFVQGFLHLHTVSFLDSHTLTAFAEMYSSLAENWFCNSLELRGREQGPRSAGRSSQSAFPSVGSHYSDRMTYKTACFCTTTSCVVYTPLNPIRLERERTVSVLQISLSGSPVLQLNETDFKF